jgi:hypothetical protein
MFPSNLTALVLLVTAGTMLLSIALIVLSPVAKSDIDYFVDSLRQ